MKPIPLDNRILIEPISETIKSAVLRSDTERDEKKLRPERGKVLATGKNYKGEVKKGDVVWYEKYQVAFREVGKLEYVVALPEDLFCVEK